MYAYVGVRFVAKVKFEEDWILSQREGALENNLLVKEKNRRDRITWEEQA